METALVLFTRDLRVHDNPALAAACRAARRVVPLFVLDPAIRAAPARRAFLAGALADLRAGLRRLGGDLVLRTGNPVAEAVRLAREVGAEGVAVARDVSAFAQRRHARLEAACRTDRLALKGFDSLTVVPPLALSPQGGDHYRVFTPYWRAWRAVPWRPVLPPPDRVTLPPGLAVGRLPGGAAGAEAGETAARRRAAQWSAADYAEGHDDLAGDRTSKLSAHLHFGCLSPRELVAREDLPEAYVRQICWRDFFHQVCAAFPQIVDTPYRRGAVEQWSGTDDDFARWAAAETGVPLVDAGMRQLAAEGWMHNRARMVVASYLTKDLGVDWRRGAAHFMDTLVDGDVANNAGNWQWIAGTGNDPRPYRRFNPYRQAERYDPDGTYQCRWRSRRDS